jgi:4-hydroxybenzoate polyprenyltransferase
MTPARAGVGSPRGAPAFARLARATRLSKVLPLFLVITNAALLAGGAPSFRRLAMAGLSLICASAAGMQINVLTDAALDRRMHPERVRWLTTNRALLVAVLSLEAAVMLAATGWLLAAGAWLQAGAVELYAAFFTLYSYNFFATGLREGARTRFKTHWLGNLVSVSACYFALWVTGFAAAPPPAEGFLRWCSLALFVCVVDYGMFLDDCAKDADAEREHGLRTLPALLGARRCSRLAAAVVCAGGMGAAGCSLGLLHGVRALAVAWYLVVQAAVACGVAAAAGDRSARGPGWERLVDAAFWVSRIGMLLLLVVAAVRRGH